MQINDDGLFWVMHIPEHSFTVLIESSRRDDAGHVGSRHSDAVIPTACDLWVGPDARDVNEWDFEAAFQCPELVSAPHEQRQLAFRYRQINQSTHLFLIVLALFFDLLPRVEISRSAEPLWIATCSVLSLWMRYWGTSRVA